LKKPSEILPLDLSNTAAAFAQQLELKLLLTAAHLFLKVSMMSDYRLDYWGSIPSRGKEFFL
jgi:hypothetical protein